MFSRRCAVIYIYLYFNKLLITPYFFNDLKLNTKNLNGIPTPFVKSNVMKKKNASALYAQIIFIKIVHIVIFFMLISCLLYTVTFLSI